jgi:hypothetical protein
MQSQGEQTVYKVNKFLKKKKPSAKSSFSLNEPSSVRSSVSGEPPLRTVSHPDPIRMLWALWALWTLLHPDRLWTLRMVFRPALRILLRPSIRPPNHPGHLSALTGTCCAIRPVIIVDTSRHVLLGSYQLVYKVSPSMGILILSSLRIPSLGA